MANEIENALDALYDFETILGYALSHKDVPDLMQMVVNIRTALKQSSAEVVTVDGMMEEEKREEEINNGQFGVGA